MKIKTIGYSDLMPRGRPSTEPRTKFGERLLDLRESKGFTQTYIAEQLGISTRAYAFWERKPVAIKAEQIVKLATIFEVSADYIVGCSKDEAKKTGPKGKLDEVFEQMHSLPRSKQKKLIGVIEALMTQDAI